MIRLIVVLLSLSAVLAAAPAPAGTVEVTVRDSDGRPLEHRHLRIRPLPVAGEAEGSSYRHRGRPRPTGADGRMTFEGVGKGTWAVDLFVSETEPYVRPADNPFTPPPRVTLLEEGEQHTLDIVLWRGVRVTAGLELPDDDSRGFRVVFSHPGSGMVRTSIFRGMLSIDRVLPPGVWDVTVEPKPGYLLVAFDRDRVPLPGHSARLDLLHEPAATFLTWTYVTPAAIEGTAFTDTGRVAPVEIVARLIEPGPWHPAVVERGGSIFDRLTANPDPIHGTYHMVVPDGRWQVQPEAPGLLASEPETVDLTLVPGQSGRADFIVRMEPGKDRRRFVVEVENERGVKLRQAVVEVVDLTEPAEPIRWGATGDYGRVSLDGLDAGSYRLIAGHANYLEGRLELPDYDPKGPEVRPSYTVRLPDGAEIRLRALDPADEPLAGVELTVERAGEDPATELKSADVADSKRVRTAITDQSGRTSLRGYYPGTFGAHAKLRGERGSRGLIQLGRAGGEPTEYRAGGGRPQREFKLEIEGTETVELEGRMLPAASLSASLLCSDGWDLPDTVAVRVWDAYDGQRELDPRDFDPDADAEDGLGIAFAADGLILGGRTRDALTVGPFEQGVYYLALKPQDFDRWTWAFEADDGAGASKLQVNVGGDFGAGGAGGAVLGDVDLGLLAVECAPAVDLLPAVAAGVPPEAETGGHDTVPVGFPDVREVAVEARFFDLEADKPAGGRLSIIRRDGRIRLRNCPGGRLRLDFSLSHPHLLPEPTLSWQVEIELERGAYRQIVPEVEALGGSIVIPGAGGSATLHGDDGVRRDVVFEAGTAEFVSLVPGRYRLEVAADGEPGDASMRVWRDLEVRAGETLRLDVPVE